VHTTFGRFEGKWLQVRTQNRETQIGPSPLGTSSFVRQRLRRLAALERQTWCHPAYPRTLCKDKQRYDKPRQDLPCRAKTENSGYFSWRTVKTYQTFLNERLVLQLIQELMVLVLSGVQQWMMQIITKSSIVNDRKTCHPCKLNQLAVRLLWIHVS
jgi:hypothetical protein